MYFKKYNLKNVSANVKYDIAEAKMHAITVYREEFSLLWQFKAVNLSVHFHEYIWFLRLPFLHVKYCQDGFLMSSLSHDFVLLQTFFQTLKIFEIQEQFFDMITYAW